MLMIVDVATQMWAPVEHYHVTASIGEEAGDRGSGKARAHNYVVGAQRGTEGCDAGIRRGLGDNIRLCVHHLNRFEIWFGAHSVF
jgi:hypothetical protein